jgi:hypothetical protein
MPYKNIQKKREHHKKYMREVWYPLNRKKHIGYVQKIKDRISEFILNYKRNGKCKDCNFKGNQYPEVLDFDHLGNKKFPLSEYHLFTSSINRVKEEIEKCDLVCANCHRIRTAIRRKIELRSK